MKKLVEFVYFNVVYALVYLLFASYRIKQVHEINRKLCRERHPKGAYILTCWHEHFIPILVAQRGHMFCPIVSRSSMGRLIGHIMKRYGFFPIFGSQKRNGVDKGGKDARDKLNDQLTLGFASAFTVDGSIGPRRVVKPGAIDLARRSQAAILPVAAVADRFWEFNTWDRLKIPKPFARITVSYGEALLVPDIENMNFLSYQEQTAQAINSQEGIAHSHLLDWTLSKWGSGETLASEGVAGSPNKEI
ncbi:MAG: DUF374 domain-containing protein [Oligoflexales bacterium]|nr:DUF374 domain-containing protein [Oligoflexales bacterium]